MMHNIKPSISGFLEKTKKTKKKIPKILMKKKSISHVVLKWWQTMPLRNEDNRKQICFIAVIQRKQICN